MKQIEYYLKGYLDEDEAIQLWLQLLKKPEDFKLFNTYISLRAYYELNT